MRDFFRIGSWADYSTDVILELTEALGSSALAGRRNPPPFWGNEQRADGLFLRGIRGVFALKFLGVREGVRNGQGHWKREALNGCLR